MEHENVSTHTGSLSNLVLGVLVDVTATHSSPGAPAMVEIASSTNLHLGVFRSFPHTPERLWQGLYQISRHQRMFAHTLARHIPGETVKMNRSDDGFHDALGILRDQTGHHAGENVSRASRCHPRISRGVYPNRPVGLRNQRAMSLQHHDQFVFAGEGAGYVDAVPLHGCYRRSSETRHLAGMRRDHQSAPLAIEFVDSAFERIEAIRVEDERSLGFR